MLEELEMEVILGDKDIEVEVSYEIAPEEKEIRYDSDGSGHPGSPACIEHLEVYHQGKNITNELSKEEILRIEDRIWYEIEKEAERYDDYPY